MRQTEIDDVEWANPANWRAGFYFSRRDSRSFVPKRNSTLGATINFARPAGYCYLLGLLGFVALIFWLNRKS
jgi:uncharacterized membrane protein